MSALTWRAPRRRGVMRPVRAAALILLFYLIQTCVMPYLKVGGVMPNLLMVVIAILTVSYGKKYAFVSGALVGIILESMASSLRLFYVLVYPSLALVAAQAFADMSDVKREMRRISRADSQPESATGANKTLWQRVRAIRLTRTSPDDLNPHLRILLNALLLTASYEVLMLVYVALDGVPVGFGHIWRVLITLAYTGSTALLVMLPARAFLGMYRRRSRSARDGRLDEIHSVPEDVLLDMAVVADMPDDMALTRAALRGKDRTDAIIDGELPETAAENGETGPLEPQENPPDPQGEEETKHDGHDGQNEPG